MTAAVLSAPRALHRLGSTPADAGRGAADATQSGMTHILLIDDDEHLGPPLAHYFQRFGLQLAQALTPADGLARLRAGGVDIAILDVMLPEMDGFALCRIIRAESRVPILMLTARGEVMARVQNVLRRRESAPEPLAADPALRFDGLLVNPATRSVQRQGAGVELTSTEFDLLHLLARSPGKVFSRDDILAALRGHEVELHTRAVDILVSRLRKKLEPLDAVKTLRNAGYTLALQRQR